MKNHSYQIVSMGFLNLSKIIYLEDGKYNYCSNCEGVEIQTVFILLTIFFLFFKFSITSPYYFNIQEQKAF